MIKIFPLLFVVSSLSYGIELEQITVEDEFAKTSIFTVDEETQINNQTLSEKLFNSVIINETSSHTNSNVISIRGNSFRATDYYEDGVPLYKNSNGYVDLSMYRANNTVIKINTGGSQGVYSPSASGGEIILVSKKVKDGFHASVDTTLSTNDTYMNLHLSDKTDSWYWKLDLNGMKRDYFKLSDNFTNTNIQANDKRVNSDKEQLDGSFKLGYFIDDFSDSTKPSLNTIIDWIFEAEDYIDNQTNHSWRETIITNEYHDIPKRTLGGRERWWTGLPIYLKHRSIRSFDTSKGDKLGIWICNRSGLNSKMTFFKK